VIIVGAAYDGLLIILDTKQNPPLETHHEQRTEQQEGSKEDTSEDIDGEEGCEERKEEWAGESGLS
jgi:hypothetical protein